MGSLKGARAVPSQRSRQPDKSWIGWRWAASHRWISLSAP